MATPTFPQTQHFYRLVEEGKITAENFQTFLGNPNKFFEENGYPVSVDYEKSLGDMIAAGKYYWKNDDITVNNFPIERPNLMAEGPYRTPGVNGTADVKLRLIHFGRVITMAQAAEEIAQHGLEPAKIEHLLAFGAKYPDKQREFPIIALGSVWVHSCGRRGVPCLGGDCSKRDLFLSWYDPSDGWVGRCRFLVVSK